MYHIVPEVRSNIYNTVHWVCHDSVRLVSPNGYILFHGRKVGFTRRFIIIIIIIIITTTPFEVEGREVGYSTVYE